MHELNGLLAGDMRFCGCPVAQILQLQPAGLQVGVFSTLVGLAILKSRWVEARCDLNLRP